MIGEDWTQRGIGAVVAAALAALGAAIKWLAGRRREEAETDGIRAKALREQAEAEEVRRVAVNGAYRSALDTWRGTAESLVASVKAEMERLREELAEERKEREEDRRQHAIEEADIRDRAQKALASMQEERDYAKDELRACRREAHALRADMEALRREMEVVRRQLEQERAARQESDERIASFEGRLGGGRERA